jgi:hypothetical protein
MNMCWIGSGSEANGRDLLDTLKPLEGLRKTTVNFAMAVCILAQIAIRYRRNTSRIRPHLDFLFTLIEE